MQTLLDYRLEKCTALSRQLVEFKDAVGRAGFEAAMNDLHSSFLQLLNSFQIKPLPALEKEELESQDRISRVRVHGITLLVWNDLVIDVGDEHTELSAVFVNKQLGAAEKLANMLWDYSDRPCDACGVYFANPGFFTPTVRVKMSDFTLAFHESCSYTTCHCEYQQ